MKKGLNEIVTLLDVPAARFVVEYVPTPRIIDIYEKAVSRYTVLKSNVR